jgi:autotransporter-associated beta strand protein
MFAAADGYGAFYGNVVVAMDASQSGFNASDLWRNDISGPGKLTLQGSGTLKLAGNNSWSGGSRVSGGVLEADSPNAFGTGDVYVGVGGVTVAGSSPVTIAGKYTQLAGTTLELDIDGNGAGVLRVGNQLTIAGGTLHVKFANGYAPKAGDTIDVIEGNGTTKQFTTITVDGHKATPVYTSNRISVRLDS